jgi:hypothetical protein
VRPDNSLAQAPYLHAPYSGIGISTLETQLVPATRCAARSPPHWISLPQGVANENRVGQNPVVSESEYLFIKEQSLYFTTNDLIQIRRGRRLIAFAGRRPA